MSKKMQQPTGFKDLLNSMMRRRWFITAIVLGGFMLIMGGIFAAIIGKNEIGGEWKELLLLLLGAFIGSYGKIIDYWFSDTDKDKMLVQKMDEEDGVSLSNTSDMPDGPKPDSTSIVPEEFSTAISNTTSTVSVTTEAPKVGVEIDEDGDGVMDGLDFDNDGIIDEYFAHRQCEHVWGDADGDGDEECLKCGKIKDIE
jgi:hypothetical protein